LTYNFIKMRMRETTEKPFSGSSCTLCRIKSIAILILISLGPLYSQNLQLQYDFRHSIDPRNNKSNYPTFAFELFKLMDNGSFFVKTQADFFGEHNNISQFYMQISRDFKFWGPPVFLHLEYNGGMGIAEGTSYGYYLNNVYLFGIDYPFQWGDDWQSVSFSYRYSILNGPNHDAQVTLYWAKHFWNNKFTFEGSFVLFTLNRNHGDASTMNLTGKRLLFWGQPQIWFNLDKNLSIGSQITLYYHIYTYSENMLIFPSAAIKYRF
jgi:hypothetical protein